MPDISVVIPSYCSKDRHGTSRLQLTLNGFDGQTLDPERFEVVIVDDESDVSLEDEIRKWSLVCNTRTIRQSHAGLCAAMNKGIMEASAPVVLLGLDDQVPGPSLLEEHLTAHKYRTDTLVVGRCRDLFHAQLFGNIITGEIVPDARESFLYTPGFEWMFTASAELELERKFVTVRDVRENFDKLLSLSGVTPVFQDIEHTISRGLCNQLRAGWLVMRFGNHSVSKDVISEVGLLDENLDQFSGWCCDLDLGIRLRKSNVDFQLAEEAYSINLVHRSSPLRSFSLTSAIAYLFNKYRTIDVVLSEIYFGRKMKIAQYSLLVERAERWWPLDIPLPCEEDNFRLSQPED